jgi:low affinity Fe/Cu permease
MNHMLYHIYQRYKKIILGSINFYDDGSLIEASILVFFGLHLIRTYFNYFFGILFKYFDYWHFIIITIIYIVTCFLYVFLYGVARNE